MEQKGSYPKWIKWSFKLWPWVFLITVAYVGVGVAIGYGSF
jgi:hypothetical protein